MSGRLTSRKISSGSVGGELEQGGAVGSVHHPDPLIFQRDAYELDHVGFVIGDQDSCAGREQGTRHGGRIDGSRGCGTTGGRCAPRNGQAARSAGQAVT